MLAELLCFPTNFIDNILLTSELSVFKHFAKTVFFVVVVFCLFVLVLFVCFKNAKSILNHLEKKKKHKKLSFT